MRRAVAAIDATRWATIAKTVFVHKTTSVKNVETLVILRYAVIHGRNPRPVKVGNVVPTVGVETSVGVNVDVDVDAVKL